MNLSFNYLYPSKDELIKIRKQIYHSEGSGFYIFKNFLPKNYVKHINKFWFDEAINDINIKKFKTKKEIFFGCPNYIYSSNTSNPNKNTIFYNFLWNNPSDQLTHDLSIQILILRNIIMSKSISNNFFEKSSQFQSTYRIVRTLNSENIVPFHKDWNSHPYIDPSALQATLFLSKNGKDYKGKGFSIENNKGKMQFFDTDLRNSIEEGDLMFWKYNNLHGISDKITSINSVGFTRMIFPVEILSKRGFIENIKKPLKLLYKKIIN